MLYPLDEAKACWRRVTAPTLWVAGRDSVLMKPFAANPDDYRARMGCFAKVREVLIDDCGHNPHHDQPEQLAAVDQAIAQNKVLFADGNRHPYRCSISPQCQLGSVLVIPLQGDRGVIGTIKLYEPKKRLFLKINHTLGKG